MFFSNGSKACAWLIYKSAAELTVRLTLHRHPLAALAGAEAKRTPLTDKQNKTGRKRGGRGAVPAEPLEDRLPLFRRARLSFTGFYRYWFIPF